jgi:hypothetical protein
LTAIEDPDFPAPAPDYTAERLAAATERGMTYLSACATVSPEGTAWAAYDWLQINDAGLPYVALLDGAAREDARFWAETASPSELQAYALAALDKLSVSPFTSRHIKRLVAALWGRMSPAEQQAFKGWITK